MLTELDRSVAREPLLTHLLVQEIRAARESEGKRSKAFDTWFRNSDAGKCSRLLGLRLLGIEDSDPFDLGSDWVIWLGTTIHTAVQRAIEKGWEGVATAESPIRLSWRGHENLTSGHLDMLLEREADGFRITYELKSINSTGFQIAVGVDKRKFTSKPPQGPRIGALAQGSLNAMATDSELLVIGYLALESFSLGLTKKLGLGQLDRFLAEWQIGPEVFIPIAEAELDRFADILETVLDGFLPAGAAPTEELVVNLSPHGAKRPWQCDYCSHLGACQQYDDGVVPHKIPLELIRKPGGMAE